MNIEINKRLFKFTPTNIVTVSLICFIFIMLAVTAQITYSILKFDRVYKGVYINDLNVANLSRDELSVMLKDKYQSKVKDSALSLKSQDKFERLSFSDMGVSYNIEEAVKSAYGVGRTGGLFQRLYDIYKTGKEVRRFELSYTYDGKKVEDAVQSLYDKTFKSVKNADLLIQADKVTIRSGHHGQNIDKKAVISEIENHIKALNVETLKIPVVTTPPNHINVDDFYTQINRETKDAQPKVENNNVTVIPEVTGRSIEKSTLSAIAAELDKTEDVEKILPVVFTAPKLTVEDVKKSLFKDTLGTMSTQFYTYTQNDANRGENIKLAVSKINGKILEPGEAFSFNGIVGPRSVESGYKIAHVYSDGQIIDDVGGGICQVSTTLYNSVLFSDLDVVERTNHMFTVGYVPLGRDAAVSYGDVDFKFKNSTDWPLKIEGWVTGDNRIFFSLKGTNVSPGKVVEINSTPVKTLNFTTKYIDDPSFPQGESIISRDGITGYIVDTYKVIKKDGNVVSETKLYTSIYNPLQKEVRRGTGKP